MKVDFKLTFTSKEIMAMVLAHVERTVTTPCAGKFDAEYSLYGSKDIEVTFTPDETAKPAHIPEREYAVPL
jgi:hypothetical protein